METLTGFLSLCGLVCVLVTAVSRERLTCEAPSSPRCFRRKADDSVYRCEWQPNGNLNTTDSRAKYHLYYNCSKSPCTTRRSIGSTDKTWYEITEEQLIQYEKVDIWVVARIGSATCTSSKWSAVLNDTVKYNAPDSISLSWSKTDLILRWSAVENFPAKAEVRYAMIGADKQPTESWTSRMANTTTEKSKYKLTVMNLLSNTAYQVQIRHLNGQARNPLWSDWSPLVIVPAELERICGVNFTTELVNGTRSVILTWQPAPHAAAVSNVTYTAEKKSPGACPCKDKRHETQRNFLVASVSYAAVSISLWAQNAAGASPTEIIHIPAVSTPDLRACKNTSLEEEIDRRSCLQLYELQDGDRGPKEVITLTAKTEDKPVKNFTRYLYFKHRCHEGKPQTVKMCLFYSREGVPVREPYELSSFSETHSSVNLSWKAIPLEKLQGFLTHYSLCVREIHPQEKPEECHHIAESRTSYGLENLTPAAKYNITLAGVTGEGEGPKATVTINTLPEKQYITLTLILSLLLVVVLILPISTWIFTRLKSTILPPVPTPVILNFTPCRPESQMIERREEIVELMLQQQHTEDKSGPRDPQETTVLGGDWDADKDGDTEDRRDSTLSGGPGDPSSTDAAVGRGREADGNAQEQVDNEIAMLIYRNGLVFDTKTDLP